MKFIRKLVGINPNMPQSNSVDTLLTMYNGNAYLVLYSNKDKARENTLINARVIPINDRDIKYHIKKLEGIYNCPITPWVV